MELTKDTILPLVNMAIDLFNQALSLPGIKPMQEVTK